MRRDSDDFDPLGIAKCQIEDVPRFTPKVVSKSKRSLSNPPMDDTDFLFQISPSNRRKTTKDPMKQNQSGLSLAPISNTQHWKEIHDNDLISAEEIFNQKEQQPTSASRRKTSSSLIPPELPTKPQKDTPSRPSQDSLIDFDSFIKRTVPAAVSYQIIHQRLQQYIDSSKLALEGYLTAITSHYDNISSVKEDMQKLRAKGFLIDRKPALYIIFFIKYSIKLTKKELENTQQKIVRMIQFQEFLTHQFGPPPEPVTIDPQLPQTSGMKKSHSFTKAQKLQARNSTVISNDYKNENVYPPAPYIDLDRFFQICDRRPEIPVDLESKIIKLSIKQSSPCPLEGQDEWMANFLSPDNKSGKCIQRFVKNAINMDVSDIDVVVNALAANPNEVPKVRQVLFDIAWQIYEYPFTNISHYELPKIFDLTPAIFKPKWLPKEVLSTPFSQLNFTQWPFKKPSEDLIELLLQTDPFVIADVFYNIISEITTIATDLGIQNNVPADDIEIDFDQLFDYLLICIFAFGISEVLEAMEFSSSFAEYSELNTQKFAMTHFSGLIQYIKNFNEQKFRNPPK